MIFSKKNDHHLMHYLILIFGLITLVFFLVYFRMNREVQFMLGVTGSGFYALWGVLHHYLEGRLNRKILFEYILFGSIAFLLFFAALYS